MPTLEAVVAVQSIAADAVRHLAGVNGIGITKTDKSATGYALKVNVEQESARDTVPTEIRGVPVVVEMIGTVSKRPAKPARKPAAKRAK